MFVKLPNKRGYVNLANMTDSYVNEGSDIPNITIYWGFSCMNEYNNVIHAYDHFKGEEASAIIAALDKLSGVTHE